MNTQETRTMPADQFESRIRRVFDKAFNQGNFAAVEELLAPDSVVHIPAWGMPANRMGLKLFIASLRTALPDLHCTVEDEILEAGRFATHWTMRGTHQGPFLGNPPSGKPVEVQGTIFARTLDDLIVEIWILVDQFGMLQQLGIVPPPGGRI
jgi:steroid delta-isomerase-like uncharacterized protein